MNAVIGTGSHPAPATLEVGVGTHTSVNRSTGSVEHGVAVEALTISPEVAANICEFSSGVGGHIRHGLDATWVAWVMGES